MAAIIEDISQNDIIFGGPLYRIIAACACKV